MATDIPATVERRTGDTTERLRRRRRWPRATESRAVFVACLLCYFASAWWFCRNDLLPMDAISRVANAYYTIYSRDPHLAAVGFVWNPLPSLVLIPVLPLKELVPALTRDGLIGALSSVLFMAGAVAVCNDILRRLCVPPVPRMLLTVLLALHPLTLIYAGNGMSEAFLLLFLALAARSLMKWLSERRPESLVGLGLSLGMAYGARYEAFAPAFAVPAVVGVVSWWRARHRRDDRFATALTDAAIVAIPALFAIALWALASKIIVDQWFPTFSSAYGNSAQVAANLENIRAATGRTIEARLGYVVRQLLGVSPLVPLLVILGAAVALRRRDPRVLAPVTVLGSVLAFDNLVFLAGSSFGWLRFQIAVVPLTVLVTGFFLVPHTRLHARADATRPRRRFAAVRGRPLLAAGGALIAVAVTLVGAAVTIRDPVLGRGESAWVTSAGRQRSGELNRLNRKVASDLDAMNLGDGSVITDSAAAFGVIIASRHPEQFVINSDFDFAATLARPRDHSLRYLLISATVGVDAVRQAYSDPRLVDPDRPDTRAWTDERGSVEWVLLPVDAL